MRIDPNLKYNQATEASGVQEARNRATQPSPGHTADTTELGGDTVRLSDAHNRMQSLKAELANVPDVRAERVAALRQKVQSGRYNPSNESIADAMMSELFGKGGRS